MLYCLVLFMLKKIALNSKKLKMILPNWNLIAAKQKKTYYTLKCDERVNVNMPLSFKLNIFLGNKNLNYTY